MPAESTQFVFPVQGASTLRQLNSMRLDGLLTDVTVVTGNQELKCHRVVLAASCPYFKAMFSHGLRECFEDSVTLHGVGHRAMELVLQYAYMGMCVITKSDAADLLTASDLLGLIPLREAAANFLGKCIDARNCLQICQLADDHSCEDLRKSALEFARKNFTDIIVQENFLDLPLSQLTSYLNDDELQVGREDLVYDAAMRWIRHDPNDREPYLDHVLGIVRLPFVKPEYLKLQSSVDPLIYHSQERVQKILEAGEDAVTENLSQNSLMRQRKPRRCFSNEVLLLLGGISQSQLGVQNEVRLITTYNPSTREWGNVGKVPDFINYSAFAVLSLGYEVVLTGGIRENKAMNDAVMFYTYSKQWRQLKPMSVARYHHASALVSGQVYVLGGTNGGSCLVDVETMGDDQASWKQLSPMPLGVKCPAVASLDSKVYVFGGFSNQYVMSQSIQIYSTVMDVWTISQSSSVDYACAQAAVVSSRIFLLGGSSRAVKVFDPKTDKWSLATRMLEKRDNCAVTAVGGELFASGGVSRSSGPLLKTIERYCPLTDAWKHETELELPVHRHEGVAVWIPNHDATSTHHNRNKPVVPEGVS